MIFKDGVDTGYKDNQNWWGDLNDPDHYRYADLDNDYPSEYFPLAEVPDVDLFVSLLMAQYQEFTGAPLRSVVEFGSGGGWYLKALQDKNLSIHGYEGSGFGVAACIERGVAPFNIDIADFRFPMERKFKLADIALCSEVAEHLEPPFHGTLVHNLTKHSNLIWFSSEPPDTNRSHLHHCAERPLAYWKALFNFFDFGCHMLPDEIHTKTHERGRCMFYNRFYNHKAK